MSKKFSLNDPNDQSTVKTNLIVDEAENKYHIENYQDQSSVKEILDANKLAQNEGAYKSNVLKEAKGYRVARLPNIVVHQLAKQGILNYNGKVLDKTRFFRWLNDSDNKHFRIYTGNLYVFSYATASSSPPAFVALYGFVELYLSFSL